MATSHTVMFCLSLLALACSGREDLDGSRQRPEGASDESGAARQVRDSEQVAVDLVAFRPLLVSHRQGALVIDAGGADFPKYIDGGIRDDWRRSVVLREPGGERRAAALVKGLAAALYFPFDRDQGGIASQGKTVPIRMRARAAVPNQLVSIFLNERKLTDLSMPEAAWKTYTIEAPEGLLREGENKLRFYFRSAGELHGERSAAAFDRFVIGASPGAERAFASTSASHGGKALAVDAESRLSAFVRVPEGASLRFTYRGAHAQLRVREPSSAGARALWSQAEEDKEGDVEVSLEELAGKLVRLDFFTEGAGTWSKMRLVRNREEPPARAARRAPRRIILWTVSSLRADRLGLDAGRGFRAFVESAFSLPALQASVVSPAGANASLMGGVFHPRGPLPASRQTLAESLQSLGYSTALFSGNNSVNDENGSAQGFGHYENPMRMRHNASARTLWRLAKRFLVKHKDDKVFLHIATVEPHLPYRPSEESLAREWHLPPPFSAAKTLSLRQQAARGKPIRPGDKAYTQALYNASVADNASAFAGMLEELAELGLEEDTAILLVGDHGEELFEHDLLGHGDTLFQEVLETPLAIRWPGLEAGEHELAATTLDVLPTVLDLAGGELPARAQGRSLVSASAGDLDRPLFSGLPNGSRAVVIGDFKLVLLAGGEVQLYDLASDPEERRDISGSEVARVRALRNALATFVAYEAVWSTARWGQPSHPLEAFALDQGM